MAPAVPEHDPFPDAAIAGLLASVRRIAVVGYSSNPARPSHYVADFLARRGYEVMGVNPGLAGQTAFGRPVVARLRDLPEAPDMVDIFRAAPQIPGVVDEALALPAPPRVIWMQLGLFSPEAARRARAAGIAVVENRCPKIEIPRLFPAGWRVA